MHLGAEEAMAVRRVGPPRRADPWSRILGRWLRAMLWIGGLAWALNWGFHWVMEPTTLPMGRVRIDGEIRHMPPDSLKQAVASQLTDSFFGLDLEQVRTTLEALPWVAQASVRRVWPGTLEVWVEERQALAQWGERGLVTPEGVVFLPEPESMPEGLIGLDGPKGSGPEVVNRYRWLRERLAPHQLEIARLTLNARGAWTLELKDGPLLQLGKRDLEARLDLFLRHYPGLRQQGMPRTVDLRYPNGFAARMQYPTDNKPQPRKEGHKG